MWGLSVPIKRGHSGWWGPKIPDCPNTLACGVTPYFFQAGQETCPFRQCHTLPLAPALRGGEAHPSLVPWLVLWGQEHIPH